jgi:hypothetical protein
VFKESIRSRDQSVNGLEEFTMGHFATELPPQVLYRIEPGTVGGQVEQDQPTRSPSQDSLDLVVLMGAGVIPGDIDRASRMSVKQSLQQLSHLAASFASSDQHEGFSRMVVDCTKTIAFPGLSGRRDHHLLALPAPHRSERWQPADVELVGVVEHLTWLQSIPRVLNRLFLTLYSGSGLLMVCWGRLSTIPAFFSSLRTVSSETRMPVCSAI